MSDKLPLSSEIKATIDDKFRLEFNYNSNHIEGNTLTYGEAELFLKFDKIEGGHDYRDYQEMEAHNVALLMVEREAYDKERPLTENFIRTLNETLLVKPYWKDAITPTGEPARKEIIPGQYKSTPNSVRLNNGTIFHYAAPTDVPNEMAALVDWYNENVDKEHPLVLAATLHYKFVRIHPFDDGNGRTARLLMNYVFIKFGYPLVIVKSEEKKDYLLALNKADIGDLDYFIDFIGNQLLWSLSIMIKAANGEPIVEEGDLDKELELLKRKLSVLPNEFDKRKSADTLVNAISTSLIPLFVGFTKLVSKLEELFIETKNYLFLYEDRNDNGGATVIISREDDTDINLWQLLVTDELKTGMIYLKFITLKKATENVDLTYMIKVKFDEFHYIIANKDETEVLFKLPYGRSLTEKNINDTVQDIARRVIVDIKSATNID